MADNAFKIKRLVHLQPQSSDPSNPVAGDAFYSDGTARAAGLWYYNGSSWAILSSGSPSAASVSYDNSTSGLTATNAQAAIDEVEARVDLDDAHRLATTNVHGIGVGNAVVGTGTTQALTNKTIVAGSNTISGLLHGTQVDNPSSGVHGVTGSVVGTSDSQILTNKTLTTPVIASITSSTGTLTVNTSGTIVVPSANDTLVGKATTDILSNKTISLSSNTVTGTASKFVTTDGSGNAVTTVATPTGSVVGTSDTQTLTNKTLTLPIISSISNSGTITLPTGTRTLVAKDTTDILTNKTVDTGTLTTCSVTDNFTFTNGSSASAPSAGFTKLYVQSGNFYLRDSSSEEAILSSKDFAMIRFLMSSDQSVTGAGVLAFDTNPVEVLNIATYSSPNGRATAPFKGICIASLNIHFTKAVNGSVGIQIQKDTVGNSVFTAMGTQSTDINTNGGTYGRDMHVSQIFEVNSGDVVRFLQDVGTATIKGNISSAYGTNGSIMFIKRI